MDFTKTPQFMNSQIPGSLQPIQNSRPITTADSKASGRLRVDVKKKKVLKKLLKNKRK